MLDIIQKEAKNSDSEGFKTPSIKALSNDIGLTSAKVSKFINQLYAERWHLNIDQPKLFIPASDFCTFYFKDGFSQQYAFFNLKVTHPIDVGDSFSWTFLLGKFSSTTFYVESIDHEHINGEMVTSIHLKSGYYNNYRRFLMDKARMLDLIDFKEMMTLSDYKIDELLYHRVEKGLGGFPQSMTKEAEYFAKRKNRWL
ncbi:hypothetical protein ABIB62_000904 [Mucilaginibacter sp. UYP25]|uniref:hypothetical protein n=1 Tax=unclassified Mucilaginibacter TaxID=2617802 RepID=UPI003399DAF1